MSGPVIRESDVVFTGSLLKQSKYLKIWKERWMVLTLQFLCSYEYPGEEKYGKTPTEFLLIKDCVSVRSAESASGMQNSFLVETPSRIFYLQAANKTEKEQWIGLIAKAMVKTSVS
jgi:PH domain